MGSIAIIDQNKMRFRMVSNKQVFARETNSPLHHGHVTHSLKVNSLKMDNNQLQILLQILISITLSFQWYIIRQVLREKQIHPYTWSRDAFFEGQQPKDGQKQVLWQKLTRFNRFCEENVSPMSSWSLDQQVPAKDVHGDFQIWICPRTISKK